MLQLLRLIIRYNNCNIKTVKDVMEHRKGQTSQFYAVAFSVWLCTAVLIINGCTPGTNHTWDSVMNKIRNKYPTVKQLSTNELQELLHNKKSINRPNFIL